ncbi:MAG: N-acetyltransferase [Anaerolineaceae bacterium]|nr:N-acetyltransferase [Anaerolineae bacterium]MBL1172245.1 N-acetyltransferase [Chloroflexota bacterium]MDL1925399.1 GNAT family N-acetyltransferase [Anaerolineae bacterium AMX1]WKZ51189.1 MAG: GNAT family protein [Anaerolineales bacterium]GJQ39962.1 MAG: N-acetyltransferase [Anaerolineaceae bacterium]
MFEQPLLTDKVVLLRRFQPRDAEALYAATRESLDDLIPWMSWANPSYAGADVAEYLRVVADSWESGRYYAFAVADARDGTLLGAASLSHVHPVYSFCNLGYWIRSSRRGAGLAPRAARLAAKYAFERLGLLRVEIVVAVENAASLRAAEKSGARREGVLRDRMTVREKVHDAVMFSFIRADFGLPPL